MSIEFQPETLADIKLTPEENEICAANVETITVSGSVSYNYETFKFEWGGSVPPGMDAMKFQKFLINKVNWSRQSARIQMERGGHIGTAMRQAKTDD